MSQWIEDEKKYLFQNYGRQPIVITRGEGSFVWDENEKQYLDFLGGLAVTSLGHTHPAVTAAIDEQSKKLVHTSNLYYTTPMITLAKNLVQLSGLDRVLFCNSGAEAVETAIKLARRWGHDLGNGAYEIISAEDGFHGRSLGALAATGTARYREPFEPLPIGFHHVAWGNIEEIKQKTTAETVAILLEPIQGEGGVNMPPSGYLQEVRDWCNKNNLLLIIDEIQTGIGRTGKLFAHEYENIQPDIMCLAKGLASGLPIGAVLARDDIALHLIPGDHGTTFGGNPVACAAANAVIETLTEGNVLEEVPVLSEEMFKQLESLADRKSIVNEVRGRGLMIAVEFDKDIAADVVNECRELGLLLNNVRPNTVRFLPPLTITKEEIQQACQILEKSIEKVTV
ncbi:MAG: acetylornithine transaminase [Dehalococcoidia bacterium]|nr:acetylornithine transaminase [Dehalococcoidia bacterium]